MKQIEILSLVLAIAVLVGLAIGGLLGWMYHPAVGAAATVFFGVRLGSAGWLFRQPDPKTHTAGVWAMLGAVAGLLAVGLYLLAEINRNMKTLVENSRGTTTP